MLPKQVHHVGTTWLGRLKRRFALFQSAHMLVIYFRKVDR